MTDPTERAADTFRRRGIDIIAHAVKMALLARPTVIRIPEWQMRNDPPKSPKRGQK